MISKILGCLQILPHLPLVTLSISHPDFLFSYWIQFSYLFQQDLPKLQLSHTGESHIVCFLKNYDRTNFGISSMQLIEHSFIMINEQNRQEDLVEWLNMVEISHFCSLSLSPEPCSITVSSICIAIKDADADTYRYVYTVYLFRTCTELQFTKWNVLSFTYFKNLT